MNAAQEIRQALSRVAELRQLAAQQGDLQTACMRIKSLQARRLAATYGDLLSSPTYAACARFFLQDLYSAQDFSERDAQFARMAGTLERALPESVVGTARTLACLHEVTETLDFAMARHWATAVGMSEAQAYVQSWRTVGQRQQRQWQLATVIEIGQSLARFTRKPGLRMLLKMMRQPAHLAGLAALHTFLESGFSHFASMARQGGSVAHFLDTIQTRERDWIKLLFDADLVDCVERMRLVLAPSAQT